MKEDKQSFIKNILWAFNIGWIMAGSVGAGFLIGKWCSVILQIDWIIILFSIIGAISGMWIIWKYYTKEENG